MAIWACSGTVGVGAGSRAIALAALMAAIPGAGYAAETVIPITPPGATDVDQASLPPAPGLYIGGVVIPYNQNTSVYDSSGNKLPAQARVHLNIQVYAPAALYVYPFKLLGGTVASSFVQPIEHLSYRIGESPTSSQFGLTDAYSDIFQWSKNVGLLGATRGAIPLAYGLNVGLGFALTIPDGDYNKSNPLRISSNVWVPTPNLALTYNTGPKLSLGDNTQISARAFYGFPTRNPYTHYRSGQIFDVDWSLTEQFGNLRVGLAGYYQTQVTGDDLGNGISLPNGNRFTDAAIGPVVEYFIPKWGAFLKAKYGYTFLHRNFVDERALILSLGFKL